MGGHVFRVTMHMLLTVTAIVSAGCSDWTGSHPASSYLAAPGQYAPPAQAATRLRVAVPMAAVNGAVGLAPDVDAQAAAADELFSLLDASGRFDLIERSRVGQMLAEQRLSDMLQPGRLMHPAAVRGFDYVILAQITSLSVQREAEPSQVSVAGIENALHVGTGWVPKLIADAKLDLTVVNAHTGAVELAGKRAFHHASAPEDFGLQLTSSQLLAMPRAQLTATDTHRLLRLVLDDALRPLLPRVDRWAAAQPSQDTTAEPTPVGPLSTGSATRPAPAILSATAICPECGARVAKDQEFCPTCGHKLR